MKKHGVEPQDTYAPVCSWNSVRLVLTLSLLLNLKTESLDFSNAFVQAELPEDQQIYIEVPPRILLAKAKSSAKAQEIALRYCICTSKVVRKM